jgi:hypothetical protein
MGILSGERPGEGNGEGLFNQPAAGFGVVPAG